VIGALLTAALAVLLWPDRQGVRRGRLAAVSGSRAGSERSPFRPGELPVPPMAGAAAAAAAATVSTPLVAGLAGTAAFLGARAWVAGRRSGRTDAELQGLTEGLGALAADLRSGRSLEAATRAAVAACADEECGRSLARAIRAPGAVSPGQPDVVVAEALGRISAAVLLSARTGCSLAAVAGAVEDDLRARRRHRQELRTATAGPRASAMLLAGLPVLGLAMGSGVGADPWAVLTTTGTGQLLLVAGVALELAGLTWSRQLVRRAVR
jgi:tight adherence protein B